MSQCLVDYLSLFFFFFFIVSWRVRPISFLFLSPFLGPFESGEVFVFIHFSTLKLTVCQVLPVHVSIFTHLFSFAHRVADLLRVVSER